MQGPTLVAIPAMWECGTVPSPVGNNMQPSTLPMHANTVPTAPTKTSSPIMMMEGHYHQALPSPLLNWRPSVNVPPPVLPPPPPATPTMPTTHKSQPELHDFSSVEEYVAYLEREVGRVELISFRVRTPDGRLTLFESEIPTRHQRRSSLKVDVEFCKGDAVDVAERNLAEWEETMPRSTVSMPDMRPYRNAITEPAHMMYDTSFCSPSSFSAVGYGQSHTVQGVMPIMSQPSPGSLQSLVAAANMPPQSLLNIRPPFAPPLSPNTVLPPTPPHNPVRGMHMHSAAAPCSNLTTPTANLFTPPDSPDFAEGSESPNSGCSTEGEIEDELSAGQRTSLKPALPGCQHSAYWKRLRHKKGTTHFLCVLCGCKWRRVSRDGEEEE